MTTYIIRRLILALIVIVIVTAMIFLAMRLLPGDPILLLVSQTELEELREDQIEQLRHEFGLDRPLFVQYLDWVSGITRGDLGQSIVHRSSVSREIGKRLPVTLHLGLVAFVISIIVGIPAGIVCAVRRATWLDTFITIFANLGITVPIFWLGVMMIYFFSLKLGWLPVFGYTSPFDDFGMSLRKIIMPVFCLAVTPIASAARQTRSSMLEVMRQDYIRTAWSKGLRERLVIAKHALKNALIPVVTLKGLSLSMIIGGSVLIESVFNIPGMGRLAVEAIFNHDYPVIQGVVLLMAVMVVLSNLLVDLSYGYLDPRIRYG
ncbi:MAG: ABC transporter permease [candidate division KSB1 bacterium]|nr:ABC transporter permease [candidate division KSB1 bacterium]